MAKQTVKTTTTKTRRKKTGGKYVKCPRCGGDGRIKKK